MNAHEILRLFPQASESFITLNSGTKKKDRGTRVCLNCKNEFAVHGRAPDAKYCSRSCCIRMIARAYPRGKRKRLHDVVLKCKTCGLEFTSQKSANRIYCSSKCSGMDSDAMKARAITRNSVPRPNVYSRCRNGWVELAGKKFFARSSWEANYARYLQFQKDQGLIVDWEHEPETFWFDGIKRGVRSYLPDFKVTTKDRVEFHEVKGWMDSKSVTKIKRMAKYHPTVKLVVIDQVRYRAIAKSARSIVPGWFSGPKGY